MKNASKGIILAAAAAALLATGCMAPTANTAGAGDSGSSTNVSEHNSCKGQNACKGKK